MGLAAPRCNAWLHSERAIILSCTHGTGWVAGVASASSASAPTTSYKRAPLMRCVQACMHGPHVGKQAGLCAWQQQPGGSWHIQPAGQGIRVLPVAHRLSCARGPAHHLLRACNPHDLQPMTTFVTCTNCGNRWVCRLASAASGFGDRVRFPGGWSYPEAASSFQSSACPHAHAAGGSSAESTTSFSMRSERQSTELSQPGGQGCGPVLAKTLTKRRHACGCMS